MTSPAVQWIPSSISAQVGDSPITVLSVVAHPPVMTGSSDISAPPSKTQTNHWTLVFRIGDSGSIEVDPSPGNGNRLNLVLSYRPGPWSAPIARCWDLQPYGITANNFLESIIEKRYHRYVFTPAGQGCRHWVARVLDLLAAKKYLEKVDTAIEATEVVWDVNGNPVQDVVQSSPEKGVFL